MHWIKEKKKKALKHDKLIDFVRINSIRSSRSNETNIRESRWKSELEAKSFELEKIKERERKREWKAWSKNWSIGRFDSRLLSLLSREKSPFLFSCENYQQHRAHNTESKSKNKFPHTCSRTSHVAGHVDCSKASRSSVFRVLSRASSPNFLRVRDIIMNWGENSAFRSNAYK